MDSRNEDITMKEILQMIIHYLWIVIIGIILGALFGVGVMKMIGPSYRSRGSILVGITIKSSSSFAYQKSEAIVETLNSLITKDVILEKTINDLNIDMTVGEFLNDYSITHYIDNKFINIECESKNSKTNCNVVNYIIKNLIFYVDINEDAYTGGDFDVSLTITDEARYLIVKKPNLTVYLLFGMIGGTIISIGIIWLIYLFSNKYINYEQVINKIKKASNVKIYDYHNNFLMIKDLKNYENMLLDFSSVQRKESLFDNLLGIKRKIKDVNDFTNNLELYGYLDENICAIIFEIDIRKHTKDDIEFKLNLFLSNEKNCLFCLLRG